MIGPNIWENRKCSKPPTSHLISTTWISQVPYLLGHFSAWFPGNPMPEEWFWRWFNRHWAYYTLNHIIYIDIVLNYIISNQIKSYHIILIILIILYHIITYCIVLYYAKFSIVMSFYPHKYGVTQEDSVSNSQAPRCRNSLRRVVNLRQNSDHWRWQISGPHMQKVEKRQGKYGQKMSKWLWSGYISPICGSLLHKELYWLAGSPGLIQ